MRAGGCFCTKRKNHNADDDARLVDTQLNVGTAGYACFVSLSLHGRYFVSRDLLVYSSIL